MGFGEELKKYQSEYSREFIDAFAEGMKTRLIASAEKGYSASRYKIEDHEPDKHIMRSEYFAKELEKKLDGVKVIYEIREKTYVLTAVKFYEYYLVFKWGE